MEQEHNIQTEVVHKIQACLKELGFEAEVKLTEHEGLVFARKEIQGKCFKIVTHITDREAKSAAGGSVGEVARSRLAQVAIRPTLAAQSATRPVIENDLTKGC